MAEREPRFEVRHVQGTGEPYLLMANELELETSRCSARQMTDAEAHTLALAPDMAEALRWMGEFHDFAPRAFGEHWRENVMPVVAKLRAIGVTDA